MKNQKTIAIKCISLLLVLVLVLPVNVMAVESRASYYLDAYSAYIYPAGWGKVQVWFDVEGTNDMDEIGALNIKLYESTDNETWTWVKTYQHYDYSGMLGYDDFSHYGYVEYNGTIGRYYKAYVCVWAGKDGDGDTRYFWTPAEKATLFAASLDYLITGKECLHSLPSKQQISDYLPCPCKTCCFYCAKRHSKPTNDCENENLPQEKVHMPSGLIQP